MEFTGILTGIVFIPIIGALVILFLNKEQRQEARVIAAGATLASLLLSGFVFLSYDVDAANEFNEANIGNPDAGLFFDFEDQISWIDELGVSYHMGVDGIAAPMIFLTGLASFAGVLISWKIDDRTREFMAFF